MAVMVVVMFSTTNRNIYTLSSKFLYARLCQDSSPVPIPKKQVLLAFGWYGASCQITSQSAASQAGTKLPLTTKTEKLSTTTSLYAFVQLCPTRTTLSPLVSTAPAGRSCFIYAGADMCKCGRLQDFPSTVAQKNNNKKYKLDVVMPRVTEQARSKVSHKK